MHANRPRPGSADEGLFLGWFLEIFHSFPSIAKAAEPFAGGHNATLAIVVYLAVVVYFDSKRDKKGTVNFSW
jgi:hypothetical protein